MTGQKGWQSSSIAVAALVHIMLMLIVGNIRFPSKISLFFKCTQCETRAWWSLHTVLVRSGNVNSTVEYVRWQLWTRIWWWDSVSKHLIRLKVFWLGQNRSPGPNNEFVTSTPSSNVQTRPIVWRTRRRSSGHKRVSAGVVSKKDLWELPSIVNTPIGCIWISVQCYFIISICCSLQYVWVSTFFLCFQSLLHLVPFWLAPSFQCPLELCNTRTQSNRFVCALLCLYSVLMFSQVCGTHENASCVASRNRCHLPNRLSDALLRCWIVQLS